MKKFLFAIALVCTALPPSNAQAASANRAGVCAARDVLTRYLAERFGETMAAVGVATTGAVIEVFVSDVGTWTILVTAPGGPTCAVVTGDGWDALPLPATGPKA